MGSVTHSLLASSARNNPPSSTASCVATGPEIVVVGISNQANANGDIVEEALHVPLKVKRAPELDDEELDEDPKGKTPVPGFDDIEADETVV